MATNEHRREPPEVEEFIENAFLTYIIPKATNLNLEEAFKDVDDTQALFDSIERRENLFFGVFLFLQTSKDLE